MLAGAMLQNVKSTFLRITIAISTLSAAIVCAQAGTATAAPDEVAITASSDGNSVTVTVGNNTADKIFCTVFGNTAGGVDPAQDPIDFSIGMGSVLTGGQLEPVTFPIGTTPLTFADVPAGQYQVDWACANNNVGDAGHEEWGTPLAISAQATTQPTLVTVTDPASPPPLFGSSS